MKAVCWHGKRNVQVDTVPDPQILNPRDAIVRVTLTGICGSDLHLYNGYVPTMKEGDILGHEFMGEVVEVGSAVTNCQARGPGHRAIPHLLRRLLVLPAGDVVSVRQFQSQLDGAGENCMATPEPAFSATPIFTAVIPGGRPSSSGFPLPIPAWKRSLRSSGMNRYFPDGYIPDRLSGCGELQYPAGGHGCGVGLRAGRSYWP